MSEKNLAQERAKGAKQLAFNMADTVHQYSGADREALEKVFSQALTPEFANNMNMTVVPNYSGASLPDFKKIFGKELVPMLQHALTVKSPSYEDLYAIEQANLKLQEHNKDGKAQENVFATKISKDKSIMPNNGPVKIDVSAYIKKDEGR